MSQTIETTIEALLENGSAILSTRDSLIAQALESLDVVEKRFIPGKALIHLQLVDGKTLSSLHYGGWDNESIDAVFGSFLDNGDGSRDDWFQAMHDCCAVLGIPEFRLVEASCLFAREDDLEPFEFWPDVRTIGGDKIEY